MENRFEKLQKLSGVATGVVWVLQAVFGFSILFGIYVWASSPGQYDPSTVLVGGSSLIGTAGLMVLFALIGRLLKNLRRQRTPFTIENARRMKRIAVLLAVLAALQFLTDLVAAFTVSAVEMPLPEGAVVVGVQRVAFQYPSFVFIVLALVVWCVGLAFEYGTVLQQQEDETL